MGDNTQKEIIAILIVAAVIVVAISNLFAFGNLLYSLPDMSKIGVLAENYSTTAVPHCSDTTGKQTAFCVQVLTRRVANQLVPGTIIIYYRAYDSPNDARTYFDNFSSLSDFTSKSSYPWIAPLLVNTTYSSAALFKVPNPLNSTISISMFAVRNNVIIEFDASSAFSDRILTNSTGVLGYNTSIINSYEYYLTKVTNSTLKVV
ncbi:MAG: hypothetical protein KGH49_03125 [Candidatus Micrarchaeota archaeon]|nr:hypothetical protein [Candidatus Micrarchaeota archaeon]